MFDDIKESLFGSEKEEKKVEYIELVYDLIFVYLIGRNSSLMHLIQDGFIIPHAFLTYLVGTLVIIQIWNYTTFYINRYGSNGFQDHMLMLVNMFLLYFMADAIRADWANYYFYKYNKQNSDKSINYCAHCVNKLKFFIVPLPHLVAQKALSR